ncbi:hypothetical protein GUF51_07630, partial [Xanthomonas citri pv. citri]|nr:hypothetical protein [Xanthomonas citri pv. citri]
MGISRAITVYKLLSEAVGSDVLGSDTGFVDGGQLYRFGLSGQQVFIEGGAIAITVDLEHPKRIMKRLLRRVCEFGFGKVVVVIDGPSPMAKMVGAERDASLVDAIRNPSSKTIPKVRRAIAAPKEVWDSVRSQHYGNVEVKFVTAKGEADTEIVRLARAITNGRAVIVSTDGDFVAGQFNVLRGFKKGPVVQVPQSNAVLAVFSLLRGDLLCVKKVAGGKIRAMATAASKLCEVATVPN